MGLQNGIKREAAHREARSLFEKSSVKNALTALELAQEHYGNHVGLLADIAGCYYHLQDFVKWKEVVRTLEFEFHKCADFLSPESRVRTLIYLGKFREEAGLIEAALDCYLKCLGEKVTAPLRLSVLSQRLRLMSHFRMDHTELSVIYRELIHLGNSLKSSIQFNIEIEHALFLAELDLFDDLVPVSRLEIVRKLGSSEDINLCTADLTEWMLMSGRSKTTEPAAISTKRESSNIFEKFVFRFANGKLNHPSLIEIISIAEGLNISSYLRLLMLAESKSTDTETRTAAQKRILFILKSFEKADRQHWLRRRDIYLSRGNVAAPPQTTLIFDVPSGQLTFQGQSIDMRKRPSTSKLLAVMAESPECAVEKVIRHIWNTDSDWNMTNRLRVLTQRTNDLLNETFGLQKVFYFNQDGIKLDSAVQILTHKGSK